MVAGDGMQLLHWLGYTIGGTGNWQKHSPNVLGKLPDILPSTIPGKVDKERGI